MTNDQLLEALIKNKIVGNEEADKIRKEIITSGKKLEEILYEKHSTDDEKIAETKAQLLNIPYKKVSLEDYDATLARFIPEETVRAYGVAPLSKQGELLVVGMMNPDNFRAQEALKFIARSSHLNLGVYVISYGDWQQIIRKYSPYSSEVEEAVKSMNLKEKEKIVELEAGGSVEDAPIIRIVAKTLREAVQSGASDVHIEPQENFLRVRFRNSGDLHEVAVMPLAVAQAIVSRIKVMSNLRIDETRTPQDGRFRTKLFDREIDFRVATFPTPLGEKVAIRVLDPKTGLKTLEQLGLVGHNAELVKVGIEKPYGMIFISGPTGSGKSTTLYALLQLLNKDEVNIVSLEDPVEYFISGVNQSQVRPEIGYDFASGLRQILRQDPDIIMVGETRDNETAGLSVHAALTGHIVLSTIHTNNASGVIPRLMDMKVEPFLLPSALNLMISQRIVSKLCDTCKKAEEAPEPIQKIIKDTLGEMPEDVTRKYSQPYKIFKAPGCDACKGKGVLGRIAVFEVLQMSPVMENIILAGPTVQKILAEGKKQGMVTMRQDGILKALDGMVGAEEVIRETE
ncbi:MAG: ATPase, T2SS/T4P/T4SS family [Candidatus Liptonbacteria bacterium]|nr:ATPase, T2SS/T4P/T4SS family [Candidatus Liptonbacteria bacterium]